MLLYASEVCGILSLPATLLGKWLTTRRPAQTSRRRGSRPCPRITSPQAVHSPIEAAADNPVRRLVAAWLLGYQSPATRRNYALDITGWLSFCDSRGIDPLAARRVHADAWARTMQAAAAAPRTVARRLAARLQLVPQRELGVSVRTAP